MRTDIKHITEISRRDLKEIADVVNLRGGDGIDVDKTDSGLVISIDGDYLAAVVKRIIYGG